MVSWQTQQPISSLITTHIIFKLNGDLPEGVVFHGFSVDSRGEEDISPVQREVTKYKAMKTVTSTEDPLSFWHRNAEALPQLSNIVPKYLCAQGTSIASERVFSIAGDLVIASRALLSKDHVDRLIFL